jgi:subtilisin family serine protease
MQIVTRCALALVLTLALVPKSALAQLRLPALPVPLATQALQTTTQRIDQTAARTLQQLSDVRHAEILQLARAHPSEVELDPDGQLIVRREILALPSDAAALDRANAAGFVVAREGNLDDLSLRLTVLTVPNRLSLKKALHELRSADPSGTYDYNHIYLGSGEIQSQPSAPNTAAAHEVIGTGNLLSARRVGLIDTGIDDTHPVFSGAQIHHWGCDNQRLPAAHGTAVASLMIGRSELFHGVQPMADLYSADVYCGKPSGGAVDALLDAFAWLVHEHVPVINISLVGPKNAMLEAVVARLTAAGFIIVAAVGNDGPAAPPLYPAAYPHVIGVTAVDANRKVLIEAARGPHVMFSAFGADTAAAGIHHDFAAVRGTSFAAPIVAGLLAAQVSAPDESQVSAALQALEEAAIDLGSTGRDFTYGFGLVGETYRADPAALLNR